MNFSSTNFPRSYHAPRDTVTRSRQAVTTVITFLPSFRFVFLSHNQVTILIAFAFLTLDTALSPARFIRGMLPFLLPFLPLSPFANPPPIPLPLSSDCSRGYPILALEVDLNSFALSLLLFNPLCGASLLLHAFLSFSFLIAPRTPVCRRYFFITPPTSFVFYRDDSITTRRSRSGPRRRQSS